ncbi:MAG: PilZ domain-containing protein [Myxococcota bacterium]|nr:PilZ domain-containing protein [Myxococcota bacterium]
MIKTLKQLREKEFAHFKKVESEHDRKERMKLTNSILITAFGDFPMSSDTRRNLRIPYSVPIKVRLENQTTKLESFDLGLKGICVSPLPQLVPNVPVTLKISLKQKTGLIGNYKDVHRDLTGFVTWLDESEKRLGIEFTNIAKENLAPIWDTIEFVVRSRC